MDVHTLYLAALVSQATFALTLILAGVERPADQRSALAGRSLRSTVLLDSYTRPCQ